MALVSAAVPPRARPEKDAAKDGVVPQGPVRLLVASRSPAWSAGIVAFVSVPPLEADAAFTVDGVLSRLDEGGYSLVLVDRFLADAPAAELAHEVARRHPGVGVEDHVTELHHLGQSTPSPQHRAHP